MIATSANPLLAAPVVSPAGQVRHSYDKLGVGTSARCLLTAADTGGAFSLFDTTYAPQGFVPLHVHENEDEIFYVLSGQFAFQVGDKIMEAGPGACVHSKRAMYHSPRNVGDTTGRVLMIATPGGFEQFFGELNELGGAPTQPSPADLERFFALMARYGMKPISPTFAELPREIAEVKTGPCADAGNHRIWPLVSSADTDGGFLLTDVDADCGGGVPPHIHTHEDETFYVLSGRFLVEIDGRGYEAGPGDVIFAPRQISHAWYCVGTEPGELVLAVTPGRNFETFAIEMSIAQLDPCKPEDIPALVALTQRFGIEMLPPVK